MNRTPNQILNSASSGECKFAKFVGLRRPLLLTTYLLLAISGLFAADLDTIQMTCRPNFGPPTDIMDLEAATGVNLGEIDINWNEPAEDPPSRFGTLVLPYPYRLRHSTNSLLNLADDTTAWWSQASEYDPNELPTPTGYGDPRADTIVLPGYAGQVVYFAMRVQDSGYLWSQNFNISSATVRDDTTPPAPISDLIALTGNYEGEINLQWTSPGDDGTVGNLTGIFLIKYDTKIITKSNFDLVPNPPIVISANNVPPLSPQTRLVQMPLSGTTYWFAIKARDDADNLSVWNSSADVPVGGQNIRASTMSAVDDDQPASVALSIGSIGFTTVELNWNAPTENIGRSDNLVNGYYDIRFSSLGAIPADVIWNTIPSYNRRMISTSTIFGAAQSYTVTGLKDDTTWWFNILVGDEIPNWSSINIAEYKAKTLDATAPGPVSNFAAVPLFSPIGREIQLTWTNPTDVDFNGIIIVYSTGTPSAFNPTAGTNYNVGDFGGYIISTGAAISYTHSQLTPFAQYFYTAYAYDLRPNYSVSATTSAIAPPSAERVPPREPRGLKIAMSSDRNYLTISWTQVTKSTDGTIANDLSHYTLYRSNSITGTATTWTLPITATSTTTYTGGLTYYYWLKTHDLALNVSEPSARVDSSIDMNILFSEPNDPKTGISIPTAISTMLYKETNSFGANIYFDIVRLTSEETGKTYRSFAFLPKKADSEEVVTGLLFSRALADVKISYNVSGGYVGAPGLAPIPANQAADNLALFWFNGVEWVKVGGTVDTTQQTVSLKTKKGGKYQLRQSMKAVKFALSKVYPRIFTPNGDGWNDVANFMYEGNDSGITGKIFDINGAFVSDMARGDTEDSLKWDGKNADGKVVSSGIYIYQIEADKKVFNGTVVVAK